MLAKRTLTQAIRTPLTRSFMPNPFQGKYRGFASTARVVRTGQPPNKSIKKSPSGTNILKPGQFSKPIITHIVSQTYRGLTEGPSTKSSFKQEEIDDIIKLLHNTLHKELKAGKFVNLTDKDISNSFTSVVQKIIDEQLPTFTFNKYEAEINKVNYFVQSLIAKYNSEFGTNKKISLTNPKTGKQSKQRNINMSLCKDMSQTIFSYYPELKHFAQLFLMQKGILYTVPGSNASKSMICEHGLTRVIAGNIPIAVQFNLMHNILKIIKKNKYNDDLFIKAITYLHTHALILYRLALGRRLFSDEINKLLAIIEKRSRAGHGTLLECLDFLINERKKNHNDISDENIEALKYALKDQLNGHIELVLMFMNSYKQLPMDSNIIVRIGTLLYTKEHIAYIMNHGHDYLTPVQKDQFEFFINEMKIKFENISGNLKLGGGQYAFNISILRTKLINIIIDKLRFSELLDSTVKMPQIECDIDNIDSYNHQDVTINFLSSLFNSLTDVYEKYVEPEITDAKIEVYYNIPYIKHTFKKVLEMQMQNIHEPTASNFFNKKPSNRYNNAHYKYVKAIKALNNLESSSNENASTYTLNSLSTKNVPSAKNAIINPIRTTNANFAKKTNLGGKRTRKYKNLRKN